jgi:hypothetical protein
LLASGGLLQPPKACSYAILLLLLCGTCLSAAGLLACLSAADALSSDGVLLSWRKEGEDYSTDEEEGSDMEEEEASAAAASGGGGGAGQHGAAAGDVLVSRDDLLNAAK